MVELKLEALDGELSKDYYVSVRVGEIQKLSRLNAGRPYKFPSAAVGERKFGKIEIFKRVGGCSVGIVPEMGVDQEVRVDLEDQSKVSFKVSLNSELKAAQKTEDKPIMRDVNPKVVAARDYLEHHNLEMRLSEAMQAVLREKPEDPSAFIAQRLAKSAGTVQKRPKSQPELGLSAAETPVSPPATAPAAASAPLAPVASKETGEAAQPVAPAASPAAALAAAPAAAPAAPKLLPFSQYYTQNMKALKAEAMQGLYSKFPAKSSTATTAASAPPAAAPAPPVLPEKPAPVEVAPEAIAKAAQPEVRVCTAEYEAKDEVAVKDRWDCRPSIGTWAGHLRGPKLPRGAAGRADSKQR